MDRDHAEFVECYNCGEDMLPQSRFMTKALVFTGVVLFLLWLF